MKGTIFDIKEFTVHDGPGARITVFLKGCPLQCRWCHNPEGLITQPQLLYRENLCTHCGACRQPCSHPECAPFEKCIHACPNGCISILGETDTADNFAKRLLKNAHLLQQMGGGITISGGEPLLQSDFVCALVQALEGVHTAIQTSGYAEEAIYRKVIGLFDYVLQDIKLIDPNLHRQYTGVSNERILQNIAWLKKSGKEFSLRVPLIPGITDTPENLTAIASIAGEHRVELMPYNELAGAKYPMLGMTYPLPNLKRQQTDLTGYFQNAVMLT